MGNHLAKRASAWCAATFGVDNAMSRRERAARFVEEAIELAQAEGLEREYVGRILDRTYSRPAGESNQEAGGAGFCLHAWGMAAGVDIDVLVERELERVEALPPDGFRKKHQAKIEAGTSEK